ncbi:thymocyte nuclear protein 1-like [Triticum dicoccoides]|uniref:thymocyte nuclear protein 1-like n=1 Tax=Triticum dicoccoides TaxID=85692 RepID=UPI0018906535|nr:thymocyte nuclear protein 1-like [Triticum dicoccoides]
MPRKAAHGATAASKKAAPTATAAKKKSASTAGKKAAPAAGNGKERAAPAASKYWLLKTEPGEWSWSDQAGAPGGVGPWDGVRNHQAMNSLRAMRRGDRCLFYHSGAGAASRRVVGVVEVAREWYEGEEGAGGAVDVRAVGELRRPVSLEEIKKAAAAGEVEGMKDFALIRQARLSVMPVPVEVWDWVCQMGGGFVQDGEVGEEAEQG